MWCFIDADGTEDATIEYYSVYNNFSQYHAKMYNNSISHLATPAVSAQSGQHSHIASPAC